MSRMPRLISDVRRRRAIIEIALVAVAGVTLFVGNGAFCHFRDDLRAEALQELAKAEECLARIDEISSAAFSRYCGDWTNLVESTSAQLQEPRHRRAEIDFLALSRSQNYQGEVTRLINEYNAATQRLYSVRNAVSEMLARGRTVSVQMDGVARKEDDQGIEAVSAALLLSRDSLSREMDSVIELFWRRGSWRRASSDAWEIIVAKDEWKNRSSLLAEYRGLTNELHKIAGSYFTTADEIDCIAKRLADVPFDGARSVDAIRAVLVSKLDEYDRCWDEAEKTLDEQQTAFERKVADLIETMERGMAELDELRRQHGSYVNVECGKELFEIEDEAARLKSSSAMRFGAAFLSVSNELVRLDAVRTETISITNTLVQIDGGNDKRTEEICQKGMALVKEMDFVNLRGGVKAGCDAVHESMEMAGALAKRFVAILGRIKDSLPDWGQLAAKITAERKFLAEENQKIKEEFGAITKTLGECLSDDDTILNSLNSMCGKISAGLRVIDASCAEHVACANGVSAERSMQTNEKIKSAVSLLWKKVRSLAEEMNAHLLDSSIYRVCYRRDPLLLRNDVVAGVPKIDFSVDVGRAGLHRIAIKLEKRQGNYLFRSFGRHDVEIQGTLSDGRGGVSSEEKTVNDSTACWRQFELTALESNCADGKNRFVLELKFSSEGHGVETGEWRFELLEFEVWIDGRKTEDVYRLERL